MISEERKVELLHAGGVGNWEWYDDSLKDHLAEPYRKEFIGDEE